MLVAHLHHEDDHVHVDADWFIGFIGRHRQGAPLVDELRQPLT